MLRPRYRDERAEMNVLPRVPEVPGVRFAFRPIAPVDENALFPEEAAPFARSVVKVRRASGAARIAARHLLAEMGHANRPILKSSSGAPVWPPGVVGSLSHASDIAAAAVALRSDFASIGVDIEPAEPLPSELLPLVGTPRERRLPGFEGHGRLLFTVKEAIYKSLSALGHGFLDHQDVEVDLDACCGCTLLGTSVPFRFAVSTHIVVLAFVPA
jgi:4'-phosphopantetheinyl transferase EntD